MLISVMVVKLTDAGILHVTIDTKRGSRPCAFIGSLAWYTQTQASSNGF